MTFSSALYPGDVVHVRSRPKKHRLSYRVFSILIDLDELPSLDRSLKLFGHNRRALFSVHDRDHGNGKEGELREWVEQRLQDAGLNVEAPRVTMLCYPRILGYVFNPITVYFCAHADGRLAAILYEVCNTFNERHTYIISVSNNEPILRHSCAKEMYVSPFVPMNCRYDFKIKPPAETVDIHIGESDEDGSLLFARFSGRRKALSDGALLQMFFTYPLMTAKITVGIHWEALRLWWKGVPIHRHKPAAAVNTSSVILQNGINQ